MRVFRRAGEETQETRNWIYPEKRRNDIHKCMQIETKGGVRELEECGIFCGM